MSFWQWLLQWLRGRLTFRRWVPERTPLETIDLDIVTGDCCQLALPDTECSYSDTKDQFTCPEGYHKQYWTCCEGTRLLGCGECTTDPGTCWDGEYICSTWWITGQSC